MLLNNNCTKSSSIVGGVAFKVLAQSGGAVEYTDCTSAEG